MLDLIPCGICLAVDLTLVHPCAQLSKEMCNNQQQRALPNQEGCHRSDHVPRPDLLTAELACCHAEQAQASPLMQQAHLCDTRDTVKA